MPKTQTLLFKGGEVYAEKTDESVARLLDPSYGELFAQAPRMLAMLKLYVEDAEESHTADFEREVKQLIYDIENS